MVFPPSLTYSNRGVAYGELGETQKAIADLDKAILINPNFAEAYYNRGVVYNELGENQKAIADYNQAIRINPNYAEAYYNRGIRSVERRKKSNKIEYYR